MLTPPACAGQMLADVDTPALIIDMDAFERNLNIMADLVSGYGVSLRPHAKTHKSPIIARRQLALGATGICCQKVSEAEILVAGGVDDILVSNQVVGAVKIARLAALACQAKISVCVDNAANIADLAAAAQRFDATIHVLVEVDVGSGRCGVQPGRPALDLAKIVDAEPRLEFAGLQAYQGAAQHIRSHEDRQDAIGHAIAATQQTVDLLAAEGIACRIVGGAGTGTFPIEAASGVYTELQAGSYIFLDAAYARNLGKEGAGSFEHALFVFAAVMSQPSDTRVIVDAGLKSFSVDSGLPEPFRRPGARYVNASDEHGVIELDASGERIVLGDKILLVPGHCDPTVNLHDWYVCVRGLGGEDAYVEAIWPVAGRGAVF